MGFKEKEETGLSKTLKSSHFLLLVVFQNLNKLTPFTNRNQSNGTKNSFAFKLSEYPLSLSDPFRRMP